MTRRRAWVGASALLALHRLALAQRPRLDLDCLFSRTASFADKILRGAKAGDLPVEQPAKFELAINAAVGRTLGLNISSTMLLRANGVIE